MAAVFEVVANVGRGDVEEMLLGGGSGELEGEGEEQEEGSPGPAREEERGAERRRLTWFSADSGRCDHEPLRQKFYRAP